MNGIKNKELKKAILSYNSMEYGLAAEHLELYRLNEPGGYDDTLALRLLAESYWKIREYKKAKMSYDKLVSITKNISSLSKLHLSQLNAMNGDYDLASRLLLGMTNEREILYGFQNTDQFIQDSLDYNVILADNKSSFNKRILSPFIWGDSLFWSMQGPDVPVLSMSNLQRLKTNKDNKRKPKKSILIEEPPSALYFNPVTISYMPATKKVYFTIKNDVDDVNHLRIAESDVKGSSLKELITFSLGTGVYTMINPVISPDGSVLIFLSNNVENQFDLYYCLKNSNNWSRPFLLTGINTMGDELFPVFDANGVLYFSSNGRAGLGGLDIYKVKLKILGGDDVVEHLPYPINTSHDDFHFSMIDDGSKGYFISDRSGKDEVYYYDFKEKYRKMFGLLKFEGNKKPIIGRLVYLYEKSISENGKWIVKDSIYSDDDGKYQFKVRPNRWYKTIVHDSLKNIESFIESNDNVTSINLETILIEDLSIKKPEREDTVVAKYIINYEYNKSKLTASSKIVLDSLVNYLKRNPSLYGVAASFTDCSGNAAYNLKLSAKRSKEMVDYLVSHGIPVSRIKESHFGNEYLIVPCEQGKFKSSTQIANRRSEIYVTKSPTQRWEQIYSDTTISNLPIEFKELDRSIINKASSISDLRKDSILPNTTVQTAKNTPQVVKPLLPSQLKISSEDIQLGKVNSDVINKAKSNEVANSFYTKPTINTTQQEGLKKTPADYQNERNNATKENQYNSPVKEDIAKTEVRNFLNKQYGNVTDIRKQNNVEAPLNVTTPLDKVGSGSKILTDLSKSMAVISNEQKRIQQYLTQRENKKSILVNSFSDSVFIEIYDNGVYDHDTISVIFNNQLVVDRKEIGTNVKDPVRLSLKLNNDPLKNQMIIVAENLGTEPPNSALMIISDKLNHRQKIYLTTDMLHNEVVYFINLNLDR